MAVTEVALIQLKPDYDEVPFLELKNRSIEVQDQWVRDNQPHLLEGKEYSNLSSFSFQKAGSPCVLITAPWDSPTGHHAWIQSPENQDVFGKLIEYVADVPDSVTVFHLNPAGDETELRGDLFTQGIDFSICRLSISPSQKESVQEKYRNLEAQAKETQPSSRVWGGWRIENDADNEELVIFWNQGVLDGQLDDLLSTPNAEQDIREFQRLE